jgi:hypothetical protein
MLAQISRALIVNTGLPPASGRCPPLPVHSSRYRGMRHSDTHRYKGGCVHTLMPLHRCGLKFGTSEASTQQAACPLVYTQTGVCAVPSASQRSADTRSPLQMYCLLFCGIWTAALIHSVRSPSTECSMLTGYHEHMRHRSHASISYVHDGTAHRHRV